MQKTAERVRKTFFSIKVETHDDFIHEVLQSLKNMIISTLRVEMRAIYKKAEEDFGYDHNNLDIKSRNTCYTKKLKKTLDMITTL